MNTRKIWLGMGLATTVALQTVDATAADTKPTAAPPARTVLAAAPATEKTDYPGTTFANALQHVLAGEGGEGGMGIVYKPGSLSIPALTGPQISQALTGNTFRRDGSFAFYFNGDGTFTGWQSSWKETAATACANAKGDKTYFVDDGQCYHRIDTDVAKGQWSVKGDTLCTKPTIEPAAGTNECTSAFLVLNSLILYSTSGKMEGKGNDLVAGRQLERKKKS